MKPASLLDVVIAIKKRLALHYKTPHLEGYFVPNAIELESGNGRTWNISGHWVNSSKRKDVIFFDEDLTLPVLFL